MEREEVGKKMLIKEPVINTPNMDLHLVIYDAVSKVKSVRRAQRRGHITRYGTLAPNRPFNNRANTSKRKGVHSRQMNEFKKGIYGRIKRTA